MLLAQELWNSMRCCRALVEFLWHLLAMCWVLVGTCWVLVAFVGFLWHLSAMCWILVGTCWVLVRFATVLAELLLALVGDLLDPCLGVVERTGKNRVVERMCVCWRLVRSIRIFWLVERMFGGKNWKELAPHKFLASVPQNCARFRTSFGKVPATPTKSQQHFQIRLQVLR